MRDGVVVINELMNFARWNKKELLLFKVDFEKAFDSVSWDYLLYILKRMKFETKWIKWIKTYVCSSSLCFDKTEVQPRSLKQIEGLVKGTLSPISFSFLQLKV